MSKRHQDPKWPRILCVIGFFALQCLSGYIHGAERWVPLGPWGGSVATIAVHPSNPLTLYAGSWTGLYRSSDGGEHWHPVTFALTNLRVFKVEFDPITPTTMYVATEYGGVFRSRNGGDTWTAINSGLDLTYIRSFAIDPQAPSTLYAGGTKGLFRSVDGGDSWTVLHSEFSDQSVYWIVLHPSDRATLYIGASGVRRSTDGGETWTLIHEGLPDSGVEALVIDPTTHSTLYAGTIPHGVFKSTDGGDTWTAANAGIEDLGITTLVFDPVTPTTLYATSFFIFSTSDGGVFRSTNGGEDWTPLNTGLRLLDVNTLAIDPLTPSRLYCGTDDGLFRSTDSGNTWSDRGTGIIGATVWAMAIDPVSPSTIYIGGERGVFRSEDGGATWIHEYNGLTGFSVWSLVIDPKTPTTLYAGVTGMDGFHGSVFRSDDKGDSWTKVGWLVSDGWSPLWFAFAPVLAIDPLFPSTLYAGAWRGLVRSDDRGETWIPVNTGLSDGDGNTDIRAIAIDPVDSSTLYVGTTVGVFRTHDRGESWAAKNPDLTDKSPYPTDLSVSSLAIDPVTPTTLYASYTGFFEHGIFRSTDQGDSWVPINSGFADVPVDVLEIDPQNPSTIYAVAGHDEIFRSNNGGDSWTAINAGLPDLPVSALIIDPTNPHRLYAGVVYGGVHVTTTLEHELYLAQFGEGDGRLFSQISLMNLSDSRPAHALIQLKDDQGQPMIVDLSGVDVEGSLAESIPASGRRVLKTDGVGPVTSGSVVVYSDEPISGGILFGGSIGVAGVSNSMLLEHGFVAPMETSSMHDVNTGVALMNSLDTEMEVAFDLCDSEGTVLATAETSLAAHGHLARYVTELDWDNSVDISNFRGLLKAFAPSGLAATVIQSRQGELATMPVAPRLAGEIAETGSAKAAMTASGEGDREHHLYFAQFGEGEDQLFSQIPLCNLSESADATAELSLRTDSGDPMYVDLNGQLVAGELQVPIPAGGLRVLQTDGQGTLEAGSLVVTSDQPLAGVVLFAGPAVGAAGVGSSMELPEGFMAPMETDEASGINTGVAIMSLETAEMTVEAELLGSDGQLLASAQLPLAGLGHAALFVTEFEWGQPVDFSRFEGLLRVRTGGSTAATVIQTRPGQFATMPVARISRAQLPN